MAILLLHAVDLLRAYWREAAGMRSVEVLKTFVKKIACGPSTIFSNTQDPPQISTLILAFQQKKSQPRCNGA